MNTATGAAWLLNFLKAERKSKPETVRQLTEYCLGWPYVFGAAGEMCTPENRRKYAGYRPEYQSKIYGACQVLNGGRSSCLDCKWSGCRVFDCRGFTRWLLLQVGIYIYGETVTTQWETASNWAAKGTNIQDMPRGLVCCVFRPGHTGMYLGKIEDRREEIEDRSDHLSDSLSTPISSLLTPISEIIHCSTIVKTENLPGSPNWQKWAVPAGLYSTEELRKAGLNVDESKNIPTLRKGSSGDEVEELQAFLNAKYGASLDVDGIFGAKTEAAVKAFQQAEGLTVDGIVGPKTRAALGLQQSTEYRVQSADDIASQETEGGIGEQDSSELCTLNSELSSPAESPGGLSGVWLPFSAWQTLRAAFAAAENVLRKYDEL